MATSLQRSIFIDSVVGSSSACKAFADALAVRKSSTAICISAPLCVLESQYHDLSRTYLDISGRLSVSYKASYHQGSQPPIWNGCATLFISSTQVQSQRIANQLLDIVNQYHSSDFIASDSTHLRLRAYSARLQELIACVRLMTSTSHLAELIILGSTPPKLRHYAYSRADSRLTEHGFRKPKGTHEGMLLSVIGDLELFKYSRKKLRELQALDISSPSLAAQVPCKELPDADSWSSTQSTTGMMTPTEAWSDVGSDTTETGHAPVITGNDMKRIIQDTVKLLVTLTNIDVQHAQESSSTLLTAAEIQTIREGHRDLNAKLSQSLGVFELRREGRTLSAEPELSSPAVPEVEALNLHHDKRLDAIIDSMEPSPTKRDVMKLIFHWTDLKDCGEYRREDIMKLEQSRQLDVEIVIQEEKERLQAASKEKTETSCRWGSDAWGNEADIEREMARRKKFGMSN
jgi:hypothetical protein